MSNDTTHVPTPRTDAALQKLGEVNAAPHEVAFAITLLARDIERELAAAKAENVALRKDRERLKWLFSGYAVARWSYEHEVGAVDRDTLMYSMFDLDDDMKSAMEGGER